MVGPVVILGGYGRAGLAIARLLRRARPEVPLVLAGRSRERAEAAAATIKGSEGAATREGVAIDLRDRLQLALQLECTRLVLMCATYEGPDDRSVLDAALSAEIDYLELNSRPVAPAPAALVAECQERGLRFLGSG